MADVVRELRTTSEYAVCAAPQSRFLTNSPRRPTAKHDDARFPSSAIARDAPIIPALVVAEATYFVNRLGARVEAAFLPGLAGWDVEGSAPGDCERMAQLVETYAAFALGGIDASRDRTRRANGSTDRDHPRPTTLHSGPAKPRRPVPAAPVANVASQPRAHKRPRAGPAPCRLYRLDGTWGPDRCQHR